jgi:hypothetical protein
VRISAAASKRANLQKQFCSWQLAGIITPISYYIGKKGILALQGIKGENISSGYV